MRSCSLRLLALLVGLASTSRVQAEPAGGLGHAAALLPDNAILITGGDDPRGVPTSGAYLYLSDWLTTEPVGNMTTPRSYHGATTLRSGHVVVIGGFGAANEVLGSIEVFDPVSGEFSASGKALEFPRYAPEVVTLPGGRLVLVRGGWTADDSVPPDEIYDLANDAVTRAGLTPAAWLETDKWDYLPGDWVVVDGGGFTPGENVVLLFDRDPLIAAPVVKTFVADGAGELNVVRAYQVRETDRDATFVLKGAGATSATSAETWFTDAKGGGIVVSSATATKVGGSGGDFSVLVGQEITLTVSLANDMPTNGGKALDMTVAVAPGAQSVWEYAPGFGAVTVLDVLPSGASKAATLRLRAKAATASATPVAFGVSAVWAQNQGVCQAEQTCAASGVSAESVLVSGPSQRLTVTQPTGTGSGTLLCRVGTGAEQACATTDYAYGTQVVVTAAPATGSTAALTGACSGTSCTLDMTVARSIGVAFTLEKRTLTVETSAGDGTGVLRCTVDGVTTACATAQYDHGTRVGVEAIADPGSSVALTGCGGATRCTLEMTLDRTIKATFTALRWTVSLGANTGNGTGSVGCGGAACPVSYAHGAQATLVATPDSVTSKFTGWTGACESQGSTCLLPMTSNLSTAPVFSLKSYTVSVVQPQEGGLILCGGAPCEGAFTVDHGTALDLVASPASADGFEFTAWTGACAGSAELTCAEPATTGDLTVSGLFSLRQEELSVAHTVTGGKLVCGSDVCPSQATHGTTVAVTAVPDIGWELDAWAGDCASEATSRCELVMNGARTASATFKRQSMTVQVDQPLKGGAIMCGESKCAPKSTFLYGDEASLTVVVATGYELAGWSKPCAGSTEPTCAFDVTSSEVVTARIDPLPEPLEISVLDDEGNILERSATISCNGVTPCTATYDHDSAMTLTAVAPVGYQFKGWSGPCGGNGGCSFTLDGPKAVTATFAPLAQSFAISREGQGSGTFLCDGAPCSEKYDYWSSITLEAVPAPGSLFREWSGNCSGADECTVEVTSETRVIATFDLESYATSLRAGQNGSVSCKGAQTCPTTALYGTPLEITALPDVGHVFSGWTGSCAGQGATCKLTVAGLVTAAAEFKPESKTLTLTPSTGGYAVCSAGGERKVCSATNSYPAGTGVQLEANKITGYVFTRWTGACEGQLGPCQLTMNTDQTVGAVFDVDPAYLTRKLTVRPSGYGRITAAMEDGTLTSLDCRTGSTANCSINVPATNPATIVVITAEAADGAKFTSWGSPCASITTNTCRVTMTGAPTVYAYFQPSKYALSARTIASKGTAGGTIKGTLNAQDVIACTTGSTNDCSTEVLNTAPAPAQRVTFTAAANATSKFWSWGGACSGSALSNGDAPPCTVTMNVAQSVVANFQPSTFTLTMQMWGAGKGTVTAAAPTPGDAGMNCTTGVAAGCSMLVPNTTITGTATQVTLSVDKVEPGSRFAGWSAPCAGSTATTCAVPIGQATWVSATFEKVAIASQ